MSGDPEEPLRPAERADPPRQAPSGRGPDPSPGPLPSDEERRERSAAARYAGIGLQFAGSLLVFGWLGDWLDGRFGTAPLFLYLGVFLGGGAAFYSMYRQLMANLEREERAKRARKGAGGGTPPRDTGGTP